MGESHPYTEELADEICKRMAGGLSLRKVCAQADMPCKRTVLEWARDKPEFAAKYARARELLVEHWAEEIVDISDDGENDYRIDDDGAKVVDYDHIQRSKLRVDSRKWIASKLLPKKYGDKQQVEHEVGASLESLINKSLGGGDDVSR